MTEQQELLKKIQEYNFAEKDLALFLDTHPNDKKALEMHCAVAKKAKELTALYEQKYAPLTTVSADSLDRWNWIDSPWPWENN